MIDPGFYNVQNAAQHCDVVEITVAESY